MKKYRKTKVIAFKFASGDYPRIFEVFSKFVTYMKNTKKKIASNFP